MLMGFVAMLFISWQVTPEVFRELDYSRNRGEKGDAPVSMDVQSKIMGQHGAEDPNDMPPVLLMEED